MQWHSSEIDRLTQPMCLTGRHFLMPPPAHSTGVASLSRSQTTTAWAMTPLWPRCAPTWRWRQTRDVTLPLKRCWRCRTMDWVRACGLGLSDEMSCWDGASK